ncbi:MAG: TrmH family RNA methyltransferase [Anaerolineales bacterium]
MDMITSRSNSKIRSARALKQRKLRDERKSFLVEGIHLVGAAVEAGAQIEAIFYAPDLLTSQYALDLIDQAREMGVDCYSTTSEVFASMASKEHPQGILAVVEQSERKLSGLIPENFPLDVACVAPQDPGNVGAILRTIDAVSASGLILLNGGVDVYHPTAVRASMGAIFRQPVVRATFHAFATWVETNGYHIYGSSSQGSQDYREIERYSLPLILLLGSEGQGLTEKQAGICDNILRIPMAGKVTSLNLAVSAGVLLYDILGKIVEGDTGY